MKSRNVERARKPSLNDAARNRRLAHSPRTVSKSISTGQKPGGFWASRANDADRPRLSPCNVCCLGKRKVVWPPTHPPSRSGPPSARATFSALSSRRRHQLLQLRSRARCLHHAVLSRDLCTHFPPSRSDRLMASSGSGSIRARLGFFQFSSPTQSGADGFRCRGYSGQGRALLAQFGRRHSECLDGFWLPSA